jgi:hypothetical protein
MRALEGLPYLNKVMRALQGNSGSTVLKHQGLDLGQYQEVQS